MDDYKKQKMTPVAEIPKEDRTEIYYKCPACGEYLFSRWDDNKHKIARPTECRDCGQALDWTHAEKTQMQIIRERDANASS